MGKSTMIWVIRPLIINCGVVDELGDLSITPHEKIDICSPT